MKGIANNIFSYSSKSYTLNVTLYTSTNQPDKDLNIALDAADIEEVVYEGKFNDLLLKGYVIYTDRYAMVDKMFNQHFAFVDIMFALNKRKNDNDVGANDIDDDNKFQHKFIASDIKILSRSGTIIKYQIDFISANWFKCAANMQYSNYGKEPEPLLEIVKNCIVKCGLAIDEQMFSKVKSQVKLNYITQMNDNLFSSLNYLMHKLYYYPTVDDSLKFVVYDWFTDKYRLFDLKDRKTSTGQYSTMMSFFKTNNEMLVQQEPTNFGSLKNCASKVDAYQTIFEKDIYGYDFNLDQFTCQIEDQQAITNYVNNKIDNGNYVQKYEPMFKIPTQTHIEYGSYWNNDHDVYNRATQMLEENTALVMNITGEIRRQPGSYTIISIDRTIEDMETDDKKEFEKRKQKYKTYEGLWLASKVRNIINPSKASFRQQLVLFRNFIPEYKASSEITKATNLTTSNNSPTSITSSNTGRSTPSQIVLPAISNVQTSIKGPSGTSSIVTNFR